MISTFLSLFTAGTLISNDVPASVPHAMPWNENVLLEATSVPEKKKENIAPVIDAKAAMVVDLKNGYILYEKNIHEPLPIASLTKLMTAVVVLEEDDIKEVATISENTVSTEGKKTWLAQGEKITVESLLYAALIDSANDAAIALAENNAGSVDAFVEKMNEKANEIGLLNTHFTNPTGLDEDNGQGNVSSAYDLTLLGRYAYGKSFVRRAVSKKEFEVASVNEAFQHKFKNTNALLDSYLKVLGLKTGTTDQAGECLITVIQNDDGNDILTVVLNSPSRYNETKLLADWTFRTYNW